MVATSCALKVARQRLHPPLQLPPQSRPGRPRHRRVRRVCYVLRVERAAGAPPALQHKLAVRNRSHAVRVKAPLRAPRSRKTICHFARHVQNGATSRVPAPGCGRRAATLMSRRRDTPSALFCERASGLHLRVGQPPAKTLLLAELSPDILKCVSYRE